MESEQQLAYLQSRRIRTGGSGCVSALLFLVGVALLLIFWPAGLILMALAWMADNKYGRAFFCGSCGNDVAPTSTLCPTCDHQLVQIPFWAKTWSFLLRGLATLIVGILLLWIAMALSGRV